MANRTGKFVGAYVEADIKLALEKEAKRLDRSVSWVIEKILSEGVKHRLAATKLASK